jgi:hypothetical protein
MVWGLGFMVADRRCGTAFGETILVYGLLFGVYGCRSKMRDCFWRGNYSNNCLW